MSILVGLLVFPASAVEKPEVTRLTNYENGSFILNWISALIALVGLVLSIIGQALKKSGLGVAAIILSILGILAGVGFLIFYLTLFSQSGDLMQILQGYY